MKVKCGDMMSYEKIIKNLIKKNNGLVLTKDIVDAGVSNQLLREYVKKELLERVAHGVYLSKEAFEDGMYVLQVRSNRAIFSHETALYLHDLTDRDPLEWTITLPSGYNATRFKKEGINVYFIKEDLHLLGVQEGKTIFGRSITVYNPERTICDLVRSRNNIDQAILIEGIKRYAASRTKNITQLMKYAKVFKVEKLLRQYLEVLL